MITGKYILKKMYLIWCSRIMFFAFYSSSLNFLLRPLVVDPNPRLGTTELVSQGANQINKQLTNIFIFSNNLEFNLIYMRTHLLLNVLVDVDLQ